MPVAGVLPAVRRDLERPADAARRQHDRLGAEQDETTEFALVGEGPADPLAVLQQIDDGALHVHVDALVDAVILQRADHLQAGAVADVGQPRVGVAAEVALEDPAVLGAVEQRAPGLELAHAVRRLLGVQLRHAPVVEVLAAAHRVGEVHPPVVAVVDVGQRRGHAALGHHGVGLAEQGLADQADANPLLRSGGDRRAQAGAAGADDQHVVLVGRETIHQINRKSCQTPIEQSRT